ncbi:MAG TPA: glycerol-3-phosphate dehydrogenase/oxidase [Acidimicrobiales bacterium]|nr:glycerol-3-phosphate dehydrogenase/oxidase [Acidimicrobiales bacterium]
MAAGPFDRAEALERLRSERFDVVVVGGGITGCGVALDAAARGLRTALVEAEDFGSGTSSRSSKLVHGGLRYLSQRDFRLVYEALAERQRLLANAPHLVRPLPFLIPLFGHDGVVARSVSHFYSVALWTYDLTGGLRMGRRHRRVDAATALRHFPDLDTERLVAGFLYWDAHADDARLTLAVARTAAAHGAIVANHAKVVGLLSRGGAAAGVALADGTEVEAAVVVNAGGVWSGEIGGLDPAAGGGDGAPAIRPAKGVHLTVPASRLPCDWAAVLPVPEDKRSVFVVPWVEPGFTYVGTTDTDYAGPLEEPRCTAADADYLLGAVNAWTGAGLRPGDVSGVWAGLRPLVADAPTARTADLSRRHHVSRSPGGVVTVTGGKLTTYRRMAADTVDLVEQSLGRRHRRSPTAGLALRGSGDVAEAAGRARAAGLDPGAVAHLAGRYGTDAADVAQLVAEDGSLAEPLVEGLPYLTAEAVFAVRREMATTLDDVLARRSRSWILDREATEAAAPRVARLLAGELGWSDDQARAEVEALAARGAQERRALSVPSLARRP